MKRDYSKWCSASLISAIYALAGVAGYSPEELKTMLDDAGFIQTEIHRMKPSNATIIGMKA